jgi:hypothetical protein
MATLEDVRRIALMLPETSADEDGIGVLNGGKVKGIAWRWKERVDPKKPRVPNSEVVAIRTADCEEKLSLIAADSDVFFTEQHYNGFPAVLVRLPNIDLAELEELLTDGWRCLAPKALIRQFDTERQIQPV